jgi:hypothetical protein
VSPRSSTISPASAGESAEDRVAVYNWQALAGELSDYVPGDFNCLHQDLYGDLAFPIQVAILLSEPGQDFTGGEFVLTEQRPRSCAVLLNLLSADECRGIVGLYSDESHFRSHVHMARHGFGKGEYRYFKYPLPQVIGGLRTALYPHLATIANEWNGRMAIPERYPATHASFLKRCHDAGQGRPTPLLLQYVPGDFNCLHQDLYGDLAFPIQVAILLSEPGQDFTGGEFVLTEQRPRMQSRAEVVPLRQGDAVAFAVHNRPVQGSKGNYRVNLRHGVSRVRSGMRHTVGIIFHDAA